MKEIELLTLAIDSSDRQFSVALLRDEKVILELESSSSEVSSEPRGGNKFPPGVSVLLFPMLERLFRKTKILPRDVSLIGITAGPGSFTGLRVGVVTAKTLAYASQVPVVGVNTLEVIAYQAAEAANYNLPIGAEKTFTISPVINAQRQQLFCGRYERSLDGAVGEVASNRIVARDAWLQELESLSQEQTVIATGVGLKPILAEIQQLPQFASGKIRIAPDSVWNATAAVTGRLARQKFLAGQTDELWTLEPFYFRPSYAEETSSKPL